ncbi:MAG: hypothetical protein Q4P15_08755 [Propionibacteriaceae bacterium]|nr:hypothetical protein [Propionibacteriaceae bacterium]
MTRPASLLLSIIALLGLVACSGAADVPPTTIRMTITAEAPAEPVVEEVPLGSVVTLEVSSEVDGLLHVHGYEEELTLVAGETASETFKANMTGAFELETHEPDAVWVKMVVS